MATATITWAREKPETAEIFRTQRMTRIGFLFGLLFPVVGMIIECARLGQFTLSALLTLQSRMPLLWLLDAAPFLLGALGYFVRVPQLLESGHFFPRRRLILRIVATVFAAELMTLPLLPLLLSGAGGGGWVAAAAGGALLAPLSALLVYLFVVRPLCRSSLQEMARTNAVLDASVDAVFVLDAWGVIHSFNPAAQTIFGYTAAEVAGQNVRLLLRRARSSGARVVGAGVSEQAQAVAVEREVTARRKDGTSFPAHLSVR